MDPKDIQAAIEAIKSGDAQAALDLLEKILVSAAGGTPSASSAPPLADGATENADVPPPPPGTPAVTSKLARLFGVKTDAEVLSQYKALQVSVETLSADKAEAELGARRDMIAELVKLGFETPATAWEGDAAKLIPCKRLASEPVADMRARVTALRATRPAVSRFEAPEVTSDVATEVAKLSKNELKAIKAKGMTPEEFIAARASAARRIG